MEMILIRNYQGNSFAYVYEMHMLILFSSILYLLTFHQKAAGINFLKLKKNSIMDCVMINLLKEKMDYS